MVWHPSVIRRLRLVFRGRDDSSLLLIESLVSTEEDCVGSTQRERSSSTEDLNLQQWSSHESSMDSSRYSGETSDVVSLEQQRTEELAAIAPPSECSVVSEAWSRRRTPCAERGRFCCFIPTIICL